MNGPTVTVTTSPIGCYIKPGTGDKVHADTDNHTCLLLMVELVEQCLRYDQTTNSAETIILPNCSKLGRINADLADISNFPRTPTAPKMCQTQSQTHDCKAPEKADFLLTSGLLNL